jgi:hypothetical protein
MKNILMFLIVASFATATFGQKVSKEIFFCSELTSSIILTDSFQILFLDIIGDNFREVPKGFTKKIITGDSTPVAFEQVILFKKPERIAEIIYATILTPIALSIDPAYTGQGVLWFAFESNGRIITVRAFQKSGIWNFDARSTQGAIARGLLFQPN